ncbi:hypothetical protein GALMADRAFT_213521 [Galerina marginata CBS 339.88]|uniref:Uncharacterized protein n=1 Tax=Galerina marginata (strain CBS 339.88) TaxID=685588 RepID=A0A067SZ84_GALM3|nr:hypothetical protein GALMADRAFT_213521 [Galerina marginata CBS 339.88]
MPDVATASTPRTPPRLQQRHHRKDSQTNPAVFGVNAQEIRSNRRSDRKIFRQSKLRGYTELRKSQLAAIRKSMNTLLGIDQDKDVVDIDAATEDEVEEFNEGTVTSPSLDPMRPFLENIKPNSWNNALCVLFTAHFEQEQGTEFTSEEIMTVEDMFMARLDRLTRVWRESRKFTGSELSEREKVAHKHARRNTRRLDLYNNRLEISYGNVKKRDGSIDPGWKATAEMIEELGPAGMSSDESEVDEETKKTTYKIRRRLWRAKACKERLLVVDSDRNITNAFGGARPGKQPRDRIRSTTATISKRGPKVGCPKNYYSREWVASLSSERMIKALAMKERKELGNVQA